MECSALSKALGLLEATAGHPEGRSLAELAAEVGVPKPTAHRILNSLTARGYLEKPVAGIYRQSVNAKRLVSDAAARRLISAAARPLRRLHTQTKETVNLGMLRHDRVLYLEVLECLLPLRWISNRTSDPFHTTALGRSIAAFLPPQKLSRLLAKARMERRTTATITDRGRLQVVLEEVARAGYAIEVDETDIGVTCLGRPVFAGDVVAGAISISVPTVRATGAGRDRLVKLLREAADATTAALSRSNPARC
jgi:DNA-binding IclR family transcriptional regulator